MTDKKKPGFKVWTVSPEEDAKTPDYDAKALEATELADKYRSNHMIPYDPPLSTGYTGLEVLQQLWGRPWDQYALNMVHALRPSCIRVVENRQGQKADASTWRVTVRLENDNRTIQSISQEVEVATIGAKHGHGLDKYLIGADPQACSSYFNVRGIKKLKLKG